MSTPTSSTEWEEEFEEQNPTERELEDQGGDVSGDTDSESEACSCPETEISFNGRDYLAAQTIHSFRQGYSSFDPVNSSQLQTSTGRCAGWKDMALPSPKSLYCFAAQ